MFGKVGMKHLIIIGNQIKKGNEMEFGVDRESPKVEVWQKVRSSDEQL